MDMDLPSNKAAVCTATRSDVSEPLDCSSYWGHLLGAFLKAVACLVVLVSERFFEESRNILFLFIIPGLWQFNQLQKLY